MTDLQTILIVDDEAHVRKYISLLVRKVCPQVKQHEAADSAAAVELFRAVEPDLVLLDINMPGVDGLDTLKALKALDVDCKVIMLTSVNIRRAVQTAIEQGAAGYILKDCSHQQMEQSLSSLAERLFPDPSSSGEQTS